MTEEKEYMTLEEAAAYIGVKRATTYNYMRDLKIESQKIGRGRKRYIALADVKRMKTYKETPWLIQAEGKEDAA